VATSSLLPPPQGDVSSLSSLRLPLAEVRFIIDIHLGKLATYLRLLGFDTLYHNDWEDEELAQIPPPATNIQNS
jgi:hypothetical protein